MKKTRKNTSEIIKTVIAVILVSGLILSMGMTALIVGMQEVVGANRSGKWLAVSGTIIRSEVKISEDRRSRSSSRMSEIVQSYQPDVAYRFTVNNTSLTGDRIKFGMVSNASLAEKTVRKYPLDKEVDIYYDPDNTNQSVLEPGYSWGLLLMPILGLVVTACGFLSVVIIWKYGSSISESVSSSIGDNFFVRAFVIIVGALLAFWGVAYYVFQR